MGSIPISGVFKFSRFMFEQGGLNGGEIQLGYEAQVAQRKSTGSTLQGS